MIRPRAVAAIAVMACAALAAQVGAGPVAVAVAVPGPDRLAALRETVAAAPGLRVVTESGRERIADPILDSSGVRSALWVPGAGHRTALLGSGRTSPADARPAIPWDRISALEVGRPKTLQGAVGGTIIGLVLGTGIALATQPRGYVSEGDAYQAIGIVSGATMAGALAGTLIGSRRGFRPIHRVDAGLEALRAAVRTPPARGRMTRLAVDLGAMVAWDLADLPGHRARLPGPLGAFAAGAGFAAGAPGAARHDGSETAIERLVQRWNRLYPPYTLEGMNDH